jgi:hypothetical protein
MEKINLRETLTRFDPRWDPKIIAELNGQHVKLVKLEGEFVWHRHDAEDELFLVVHGGSTCSSAIASCRWTRGSSSSFHEASTCARLPTRRAR